MTLTPEARAQLLSNEILDRGMAGIISTECRALIASAIRAAENDMAERAAVLCDDRRRLSESRGVQSDAHETISHVTTCCALDIRALKHED